MKQSTKIYTGRVSCYLAIVALWLSWNELAFGQEWLMISSYGSPGFRTAFVTGSSVNGFMTTSRMGSMSLTNVDLGFRPSISNPNVSITGTISTYRLGTITFTDIDLRLRPNFGEPPLSLTGTLSTHRLGATTFTDVNMRLRPSSFGVTGNLPTLTITGSSQSWSLGRTTFTNSTLWFKQSPF